MWRWTVALGVLLLLQLTLGSLSPNDFANRRMALKDRVDDDYGEFSKFAVKELRELVSNALEAPNDNIEGIKSYEEFLNKTQNFERPFVLPFFMIEANGIAAIDILDAIIIYTDLDSDITKKKVVLENYEKFISTAERIALRLLKCFEQISVHVSDYLGALTAEEQRKEIIMLYWYDIWLHTQDFSTRMKMIYDFEIMLHSPESKEDKEDMCQSHLSFAFDRYVRAMKKIVESMREVKLLIGWKNIEQLMKEGTDNAMKEMPKYYREFNKWLTDNGPAYFEYQKEAFKCTVLFFKDIDFHIELLFKYVNVKPKLLEWYADLKKTNTFEESIEKYFNVYTLLESD